MRLPPLALGLGMAALLATAAGTGDLTLQERGQARKVYVAKCAKCHRFHDPTHYTEPDWRRWMSSMSRKAKLKPEQDELLSRYLDAYRAGRLPTKPEKPAPR
jgi:hypothetical protein